MTEVNVLFINGWGGDLTSMTLAALRNRIVGRFGRTIYAPPPVNHTETGMILRYLEKWKDAQILVGLSCGDSTINLIAEHAPKGEDIPFAMFYSPSMWCKLGTTPALIKVACEVNSWAFDPFNPGARQLLKPAPGNTTTKFERIKTNYAHGLTPNDAEAEQRLIRAISDAQKGK